MLESMHANGTWAIVSVSTQIAVRLTSCKFQHGEFKFDPSEYYFNLGDEVDEFSSYTFEEYSSSNEWWNETYLCDCESDSEMECLKLLLQSLEKKGVECLIDDDNANVILVFNIN